MTDNIDSYTWSSHKGYLSVAKKWEWLNKRFILAVLTGDTKQWLKQYKRFISVENDKEITEIIDKKVQLRQQHCRKDERSDWHRQKG